MRFLLPILLLFVATPAFAADPPPLARQDAQLILEAMDWKEITIVGVLQGVDAKGTYSPVNATVLGLGTKNGRHQRICQTMYHDAVNGWFFFELEDRQARLWTTDGYREIRPWTTW